MQRDDLCRLLAKELNIAAFKDYCPNGLQVEGRASIRRIVTGVTASQALLDEAVALKADALLVHHGYFWKGETETITGIKYRRIKTLLDNDISLLAYHLPLDAHPSLGNNAQLARFLDLAGTAQPLDADDPTSLIWQGEYAQAISAQSLKTKLSLGLAREALLIDAGDRPIKRIAWCTGAAQSYIEDAAAAGVDAFISGEISEPTVHLARELGIHYIAAGHHATERYGIQALGDWLKETQGIEHIFVDVPNPV